VHRENKKKKNACIFFALDILNVFTIFPNACILFNWIYEGLITYEFIKERLFVEIFS